MPKALAMHPKHTIQEFNKNLIYPEILYGVYQEYFLQYNNNIWFHNI